MGGGISFWGGRRVYREVEVGARVARRAGRGTCGLNLTLDKKKTGNFTRVKIFELLRRYNLGPSVVINADINSLVNTLFTSNCASSRVGRLFANHRFSRFTRLRVPGSKLFSDGQFHCFLHHRLETGAFRRLGAPLIIITASLSGNRDRRFHDNPVMRTIATSYDVPVVFDPIIVGKIRCISKNLFRGFPISVVHRRYRHVVNIGIDPLIPRGCGRAVFRVTRHSCRCVFQTGALRSHRVYSILVRTRRFNVCGAFSLRGISRVTDVKCTTTVQTFRIIVGRGGCRALIGTVVTEEGGTLVP